MYDHMTTNTTINMPTTHAQTNHKCCRSQMQNHKYTHLTICMLNNRQYDYMITNAPTINNSTTNAQAHHIPDADDKTMAPTLPPHP